MFGLTSNKVDKAIDSTLGTNLAAEERPLEEQPTEQEILISELQATITAQNEHMRINFTPQKVGLVEPFVFDPQVHYEILTEAFGVFKSVSKIYHYGCRCGHEWTTRDRLDGDELHECPSCEDEYTDGDGLFDYVREEVITSRAPTQCEICLIYFGNEERAELAWLMTGIQSSLVGYFAQLNGHASDQVQLDYGSKIQLYRLPAAGVEVDEEDLEDDDELF